MKWSALNHDFKGFKEGGHGKATKPEEIVAKLRRVDVLTAPGRLVAEAMRLVGMTEVTFYPWRKGSRRFIVG